MTSIGSYEAKTHLPALLKRVGKGERIVITRRGVPIAMLSPASPEPSRNIVDVLREMKNLRRGNRLGRKKGESLRQLAHAGHRY